MPLRKNAGTLLIKEQIIQLNGLTILFRVGAPSAPYRVSILGSALPFGNYEIIFDEDGVEAWRGAEIPAPRMTEEAF